MSGSDIAVRVARINTVAERIKRIRLVRTNGGPLPTFSAGSHVVIAMREGNRTIKNPYSLMGSLSDSSGYEIAAMRSVS